MLRGVAILLIAIATGCSSEPTYPLRSHTLTPLKGSDVPPAVSGLGDRASFARWSAAPSRLAADIPRAVKRSNWGLIEISDAPEPNAGGAALKPATPIRAEAMLPDNRVATIQAWCIGANEVAVGVRIGHFGDAKIEAAFLQMLADTLADKPAPKRGGTFELPDNWPSP